MQKCYSCPLNSIKFGTKCYYMDTNNKRQTEAKAACSTYGGRLAEIINEDQFIFMQQFVYWKTQVQNYNLQSKWVRKRREREFFKISLVSTYLIRLGGCNKSKCL